MTTPTKRRALPIVAALLLVLVMVGGAAYYVLGRTSGPKLAASVPGDTQVYLEIPDVRGAFAELAKMDMIDPAHFDAKKLVGQLKDGVRDGFGVGDDVAGQLVEAIDGIAFAAHPKDKQSPAAALVSFRKSAPVDKLLAAARFKSAGDFAGGKRFTLERGAQKPATGAWSAGLIQTLAVGEEDALVWFDKAKILVAGDADMVEAIGGVITGGKESLAQSARWKAIEVDRGATAILYGDSALLDQLGADTKAIIHGYLDGVPPWAVISKITRAGLLVYVSGVLKGSKISSDAPITAPTKLELPKKLPGESFVYLAGSIKTEVHGKELRERIVKRMAAHDESGAKKLEAFFADMPAKVGFSADDLFDAVGDEIVLGVAAERELKFDPTKGTEEYLGESALALLIDVHDKDAAKRVIVAIRDKAQKELDGYTIEAKGDGFDGHPKKPGRWDPEIRVRLAGSTIVAGLGGLADRVVEAADKGKDTLGDDAAHRLAREQLIAKPSALVWLDTARIIRAVNDLAGVQRAVADGIAKLEKESGVSLASIRTQGDKRMTSALALGLEPRGAELHYRLEAFNAPVFGVASALGVYGVRRYLSSAKTSEAKQAIGAISRSAVAAYEREAMEGDTVVSHKLCTSAVSVPSAVQRGTKYQPHADDGADYESGSATGGWKCLKFSLIQPHYYQYSYSAGGPYKGPARGGPDPGPSGFEAAAEGDLDGDGVTSLFTRTGTVDPTTGELRVSPQIFIDNEFE